MRSLRPTSLLHPATALGAAAFVAVLGARPLWHDDLFVHLRTGEMVAETGTVPRVDPFTHTVAGNPWTAHEWGFGLLLHAGHALGGTTALLFYMPVLLVLIFLALYAQMRRYVAPARLALIVPLLLLGVGAAEVSCFILRAALVTTLGLALVGELLQRFRTSGSRLYAVAIGLVVLVWANMHAGVVFGVFTVGLYWLQAAFDRRPTSPKAFLAALLRRDSRKHLWLLVACAGLTLVNPSGLELWTFPFRVNELFYRSDITWSLGQYRAPRIGIYPWFYLLVVVGLVACLPFRRLLDAMRARRAPLLAQSLGAAFFLVMALRSNRFIFDFVVFAAPFCAMRWGGRAEDGARPPEEPAPPARPTAWFDAAALTLVVASFVLVRPALPARALDATVPECLADFMARERIEGRMFNYERSGGYLGWRLRQPVYWDGRNDIFGPLAVEFAYAQGLAELVERHRLDILVLNRSYHDKFRSYLTPRGPFALVYWDDHSALYLKRGERFRELLARSEYLLLQPFGLPSPAELRKLDTMPALRLQVAREVERAISQCRDNHAARQLQALMRARHNPRSTRPRPTH